ncbi:hypothetical protein PMIN02_013079, partial [Paraphaeosphaeria minitans]
IPPQLGAGSFGVVYRAVDVDSGKLIAVKIVKQVDSQALQLKREVELLSQLDHVSIACPVYMNIS